MRAAPLLLAALALTAACAPRQPSYGPPPYGQTGPMPVDPSLGVHVTPSGRVVPSAAVGVGGVRVAASPFGGAVGTRFGPIRLSAGF